MPRTNLLKNLDGEIEKLSPDELLKLVEKLVHLLRKNGLGGKKELAWDKLYGLGKNLWEGEDAQKYVNRIRSDRQ